MTIYPDVASVVATLGGAKLLHSRVRTLGDLRLRVREGLPLESLYVLTRRFPASQRQRIEQLIAPRSTLQRRHATGVLNTEESERLERLARVTTLAEQVWEDRETAQSWLNDPLPLFDGEAPLDLAASDLGARRVEEVLWKLEYSLPV